MKNMKLFPKTFLHCLGLMVGVILTVFLLIYSFLPTFYQSYKQRELNTDTTQLAEELQGQNEKEISIAVASYAASKGYGYTAQYENGEIICSASVGISFEMFGGDLAIGDKDSAISFDVDSATSETTFETVDGKTVYCASTKKELFDSGIIENEDELQRILDSKRNLVGSLMGYTDLSIVDDFADNANKLESGHFPEQDNECIVSSKYAEYNNLKIGDTISISGPSKSDTEIMSLTITGIYAAHRAEASAETLGDIYGYVYTTFNTLKNSGFHYIWVGNAIFQLGNPEEAELFEKELHEKGLSKYRILSYSNTGDEYTKNTEPLKNISRIAEVFTLAASIIGAAILLLISFFNIRERKYEIGVLRAMGMKKSDVARGMVYETLVIMFVSFVLSVILGLVLTKPIAVILLGDLTGVNTMLSPMAILLGACMAFLFSVLAGFCSVFAVMRHEPMQILAERN